MSSHHPRGSPVKVKDPPPGDGRLQARLGRNSDWDQGSPERRHRPTDADLAVELAKAERDHAEPHGPSGPTGRDDPRD